MIALVKPFNVVLYVSIAHEEGKCVIIVTHSSNVCEKVDKVFELKKI